MTQKDKFLKKLFQKVLTKGEVIWYTVVPLEESGITDGPMKYLRRKSEKNFAKGIDKGKEDVI